MNKLNIRHNGKLLKLRIGDKVVERFSNGKILNSIYIRYYENDDPNVTVSHIVNRKFRSVGDIVDYFMDNQTTKILKLYVEL